MFIVSPGKYSKDIEKRIHGSGEPSVGEIYADSSLIMLTTFSEAFSVLD